MLSAILSISLNNRALVLTLAGLVLGVGVWLGRGLPIDVLPDLDRPRVSILTEVPASPPEPVERLVTVPIEQAVLGVAGVQRVRSQSSYGLSVVQVEFGWGTDPYQARQQVQERLQSVTDRLPEQAVPMLAPIASILGQVQITGFRLPPAAADGAGDDGLVLSADELRAFIDASVAPRLRAVPGVAQVLVTGGAPRHLRVEVDPDKLRAHGVGLLDVADAVRRADSSTGGAPINTGYRARSVQVDGLVEGPDEIARAVVREDPIRPVLVADVADVAFGGAAVKVGEAAVNGSPAVMVILSKAPGFDTLELTERLQEELDSIAPTLPAGVEVLPGLYRQSDFIHRAVDNVAEAVWLGAILVSLVLLLFLWNLRTTAITLTALPLSVALTVLVFGWAGMSINTMTLGGLAIAIGALVDDAIVDVENVFRRLRMSAARGAYRVVPVVLDASNEVRRPILVGTLVVALAFVPLTALPGLPGRLFAPIGLTYVVAVLASLLVALTVTPVMCSLLLPRLAARRQSEEGAGLAAFAERSGRVLVRWSLAHRAPVLVASVAMALLSVAALVGMPRGFLPPLKEDSVQISMVAPPESSVATSDALAARVDRELMLVDGVESVARRTGRAAGDEHIMPAYVSEAILRLGDTERSREEILDDVRTAVGRALPGLQVAVEQPMGHLISVLVSGVGSEVAIKLSGAELSVLRAAAAEVVEALEGIDGVTDVVAPSGSASPQLRVVPDRRRMAALGVDTQEVADAVALSLEGEPVGVVRTDTVPIPISLGVPERDRADLARLPVRANPAGRLVQLGDVAELKPMRGPEQIQREGGLRTLIVQHNVGDRPMGEVLREVEAAMAGIQAGMPAGHSLRIEGRFAEAEAAQSQMLWLGVVALLAILAVLYSHFRSLNLALQAMLAVPIALPGAVLWLRLTGQTLSLPVVVGLIALSGVVVRNSVLLLDRYLHLVREEGMDLSPAMFIRAGGERLVPVLMTALTSGLALVPLLLAPDEPGREILAPIAGILVGGLFSSTLLDVLVTPVVFAMVGGQAVRAQMAAEEATVPGLVGEPMPQPN